MAQFAGGFAGEGDNHAVIGFRRAVLNAAGHPEGEDPGLPRPGPGLDAHRGRGGVDRMALGVGKGGHDPGERFRAGFVDAGQPGARRSDGSTGAEAIGRVCPC